MSSHLAAKIVGLDWDSIQQTLDKLGYAHIPKLLNSDQCSEIMNTYEDERHFRSTINMARYRFGLGEYKYYEAPLPDLIEELRVGLYPELAKAANRWREQLGSDPSYPTILSEFLAQCHDQDQIRSTPLILKYEVGGYNCLHQDLYGDVFFPFQVVFALNEKDADYTGGEFLLVEQRSRAQSRGHVITLEQGAGLIFPTSYRPVVGSRGYYKTTLRHGVSTITSGTRFSLGIIFHDAR
ncbi:prolyl 4-hydroxylase subunit alpha [Paenibacillus macquariensis subsp. defensor]|nr:prolyl 4-hydroxylase subunit alpha [Paenibacillus macquariensis subsp. defensor]